ncbi:MAG: HIRAN protein [Betaproteobacteria bacterium]|nr:HIRAN protein [Betaproteobacteria bacterium]
MRRLDAVPVLRVLAGVVFSAGLSLVAVPAAGAQPTAAASARVVLQTTLTAGLAHHDAKAVWEALRIGDRLQLVRESGNLHDPNAVAVRWRGRTLGYLPRTENADVARQLDRGQTLDARIRTIAKYRNHRRKLVIDILAPL